MTCAKSLDSMLHRCNPTPELLANMLDFVLSGLSMNHVEKDNVISFERSRYQSSCRLNGVAFG